jgi:hypothetical protein
MDSRPRHYIQIEWYPPPAKVPYTHQRGVWVCCTDNRINCRDSSRQKLVMKNAHKHTFHGLNWNPRECKPRTHNGYAFS